MVKYQTSCTNEETAGYMTLASGKNISITGFEPLTTLGVLLSETTLPLKSYFLYNNSNFKVNYPKIDYFGDNFLGKYHVNSSVTELCNDIAVPSYSTTTSTTLDQDSVLVSYAKLTCPLPEPTPAQRLRARIRTNMSGYKGSYRHLTCVPISDPEHRARALLRDMIGEGPFRNYLKKGFVTVRGRTGIIYKIMRGEASSSIVSFAPTKEGKYKPFETICIVFRDRGLPPTDTVIMRVMMCLHDEFGMRAAANVWRASRSAEDCEFVLGEYGNLAKARNGGNGHYVVAGNGNYMIRTA